MSNAPGCATSGAASPGAGWACARPAAPSGASGLLSLSVMATGAGSAAGALTAGASAPEVLVREVVDALAKLRPIHERTIKTAEEKMVFKLPRQLTE